MKFNSVVPSHVRMKSVLIGQVLWAPRGPRTHLSLSCAPVRAGMKIIHHKDFTIEIISLFQLNGVPLNVCDAQPAGITVGKCYFPSLSSIKSINQSINLYHEHLNTELLDTEQMAQVF